MKLRGGLIYGFGAGLKCGFSKFGVWRLLGVFFAGALTAVLCAAQYAYARDVDYQGSEIAVYVTPGEPSQITFPGDIGGGFKKKHSSLALERKGNFLVVFAQPEIPYEGEALLVLLQDKRSYALRILPSDDDNKRDEFIVIRDTRENIEGPSGGPGSVDEFIQGRGYTSPALVPGLMRAMILSSEKGLRGGIEGYRRSNRYTGETILHDGTVEAKIKEIFMGTDFWGYVIEVENLLDTNYKLNPATFQLDGTRAVSAERWELAPRPVTAEQKLAGGHRGNIYIITAAQRR